MSFHILHILSHGGSLYKERGRLFFRSSQNLQSLPIENVRAIIIAARGISISSQLLSALLQADCLLLHCDERYKPIGWTLPIPRTIHQTILEGQLSPRGRFREQLWRKILSQKIVNQRTILKYIEIDPNPLESSHPKDWEEGVAARIYFRTYFKFLEAKGQTRSKRQHGWLNPLLNYGYAVLTAMVHRSVIVHGLMANIGVHHKARYRSYPLVYDLMEPFRPIVDGLLVNWLLNMSVHPKQQKTDDYIEHFGKFIGMGLREFRMSHSRYSLKLIDAIDIYIRDIAKAFQSQSLEGIWLPHIDLERLAQYHVTAQHFQNG